jgi:hypothetical protein
VKYRTLQQITASAQEPGTRPHRFSKKTSLPFYNQPDEARPKVRQQQWNNDFTPFRQCFYDMGQRAGFQFARTLELNYQSG